MKVVQRSWESFKSTQAESTTVGLAVFKRFLRHHPAFLQLFPFRDQPLETLFLNAKVRLHCKLFADTVSQTVGSLGDSVAVKASLRELGARHCDQYKVEVWPLRRDGERVAGGARTQPRGVVGRRDEDRVGGDVGVHHEADAEGGGVEGRVPATSKFILIVDSKTRAE